MNGFSSVQFFFTARASFQPQKSLLCCKEQQVSVVQTFAAGNCTGAYNMVRLLMTGESAFAFYSKKFIHFALEETKKYTDFQLYRCEPICLNTHKDNFSCLAATDGKAQLEMLAFESPKIRLLRSLTIEGVTECRPEFDLPIFCANFFTTASMNIVVSDLDPLCGVISQKDYKGKYYKHLIPLGLEYAESWLELMEQASREADIPQIMLNLESQHRYLTLRAEKDPGHQVLRRLTGETLAKSTSVMKSEAQYDWKIVQKSSVGMQEESSLVTP